MPKEMITREEFDKVVQEMEEKIDYLEKVIDRFAKYEPKPLKRYSKNGFAAGGFKIFKYLPEDHHLLKTAINDHDFSVDEVDIGFVLVKKEN